MCRIYELFYTSVFKSIEYAFSAGCLLLFLKILFKSLECDSQVYYRIFPNENIVQLVKKKKKKTTYFNTNYSAEMKLVPIIMDFCLLQFDVLKFFLGARLHGGVST